MKIGIDISQLAYPETGVSNYLKNLVENLIAQDKENEYILFFSSLRKELDGDFVNGLTSSRVNVRTFRLPPRVLDLLWNRLHIAPIEWFIGNIDLFITSDWTEPPVKKAKKVTILYDLIVYKHPEETAKSIVATHKRRLHWVIKESKAIFCISESTKSDAKNSLGIDESKLFVLYPGATL